MPQKIFKDAATALDGLLFEGMKVAVGGFGLSGIPETLIAGIRAAGTSGITAISNNAALMISG